MTSEEITDQEIQGAVASLGLATEPPASIGKCWACERDADLFLIVSPQAMRPFKHTPAIHAQFHDMLNGKHAVLRVSGTLEVTHA